MSWASTRQTLILAIVGSFVALVAAGVLISVVYQTPSCSDGTQNQDEEGVDCGGACQLLCTDSQSAPVVSFVRELPQRSGRLDVIAYVQNPNPFAGTKDAQYQIELLSDTGVVLGTIEGKVDLPPAAEVPIFIAGAYPDALVVRQVFLTFIDSSLRWYTPEELPVLRVDAVQIAGSQAEPRIIATVHNPGVDGLRNVKVVATLFDGEGNAYAASQTVVAELRARGQSDVTFTWNAPWREAPSRIDVRPVRDL